MKSGTSSPAGPSRAAAATSPRSVIANIPPKGLAENVVSPEHQDDLLSDSDEGQTDAEDMEDYETLRLRRIKENQMLLDELGIYPSFAASASTSSLGPAATPQVGRPKKQRAVRPPVYDRSGYIISQPAPGQTFRMACVEMPSDRKVRKRIADGEYQDCSHWAAGEEHRWRFGDGEGVYEQGEEAVVGGVGPDFRWRRWRGLEHELRREMRMRGELNEVDMRVTRAAAAEGASDYSSIPGSACHQCRRKSDKLKMKCRNTVKECNAVFCETCCTRYSYFEFDPDSRSFICPLCRDVCNCSNCIRKRDLAHLLDSDGLKRAKSLRHTLRKEGKGQLTVQEWLEEAANQTLRAPFDRVRLVNADEDVISPELPPLEPESSSTTVKPKKSKKAKSTDRKGGPKKIARTEQEQEADMIEAVPPTKIMLKFTAPNGPRASTSPKKSRALKVREKEVDSDGDTVNGWTGDEDEPIASVSRSRSRSQTSTITPISSREPTPPPRLAFPPRPAPFIVPDLPAFTVKGFIYPAMMNQPLPRPPLDTADHPFPETHDTTSPKITPEVLETSSDSLRKRKLPSMTADTTNHPHHQQTRKSTSKFEPHPPSSPDPIAGPLEPPTSTSSFLFSHSNGHNDNSNTYSSFGAAFSRSNGSAMLSADPPPYSHSPPRRRRELDSPDRSESFLPPAPMAYSLAQHLRVGSSSPQDGDSDGYGSR